MNSICIDTYIELEGEVSLLRAYEASFSKLLKVPSLATSILITILTVLLCAVSAQAQTDFYNKNFVKLTNLNDIKTFVSEMKETCDADRYRINKTAVVEYYDKQDKSFKGLSIDSNLEAIDKINVIKRDKQLKKFIKIHGIQLGSALYFKRPFEGMTQGQLKLIVGEPDKLKYAIEGESQVIHFKYADGRVYSFKDGALMSAFSETTKSPIALKQP